MSILNEAAWVKPPLAGGVIMLTVSTTAGRFVVPDGWDGAQATLYLIGDSGSIYADIAFGDSTVSVALSTYSSVSTMVITVNAETGMRIESGQRVPMVLPTKDIATHFSVDASAAGALQIIKG